MQERSIAIVAREFARGFVLKELVEDDVCLDKEGILRGKEGETTTRLAVSVERRDKFILCDILPEIIGRSVARDDPKGINVVAL